MRRLALLALLLLPSAAAAPEQVHLGLAESDALAGYTVSWVNTAPGDPTGLTFHGPDGDVEVEGRVMPGPTPGVVVEATLPPLAPGANASYTLGGKTHELRVPGNASLRLVAIGDMGTTRAAGDAVEIIAQQAPHLVFHVGDVSYAGGDPLTWKAWFDLAEPVAATIPWVPALGNHEGDVLGIANEEQDANVVDPSEQAFFEQRFPLPGDDFWYSFDLGGVHFVALDTFSWFTLPEEEPAWLAADLAAARDAEWTIAYLHEPPYSSNARHGSSARAREAFASILEEAGVDLVVTGHDHHYERSHPLRGDAVVARGNVTTKGNGTLYVVTGGGGAPLYETFVDPQPEWSAFREAAHHVLALEVTHERIVGRALATADGRVLDEFRIERAADPVAVPTETPALAPLALVAVVAAFALLRRR